MATRPTVPARSERPADRISDGGAVSDADIAVAADAVRRFLGGRVQDRTHAEDLVQEAITRLIEVRDRLDGAAAAPYAITIVKNLLVANARRAEVEKRHAHRVIDLTGRPPSPEEAALRRDEVDAVAAALEGLAVDDRRALLAHVIEGRPTASLAEESGGTAGGVAARLARSRASMRVDYVLASRRVTLPTARCRPILNAISAGDQRRQHRLFAARHLLDCRTCASVAPPLLERQRSLVALAPLPIVAVALGRMRHAVRSPQAVAVGAVTAAVAAGGLALAVRHDPPAPSAAPTTVTTTTTAPTTVPAPPPSIPLEIDGQAALDVLGAGRIVDHVGQPVVGRAVTVVSVPSDEGFWVGDGPDRRMWVQFSTSVESTVQITPGARLSFTGVLVGHGAGYGAGLGLDPSDAQRIDGDGAHIEVDPAGVTVE
jgi:RNA polymerase sigma factor (sigma-70 family)